MSMEVDFTYPRQLQDMKTLKVALRQFDCNMNKMMVVMSELGSALQGVSSAFSGLTSLSFTPLNVKCYVHRFAEEITTMKDGLPFQMYNSKVHDEVVSPIRSLKKALSYTKEMAKKRDKSFAKYRSVKKKVDALEHKYALQNRSLSSCRSYPLMTWERDQRHNVYEVQQTHFKESFVSMITMVGNVTAHVMRRYLELNAAYMASLMKALTRTDHHVTEIVAHVQECLSVPKTEEQHNINHCNTGIMCKHIDPMTMSDRKADKVKLVTDDSTALCHCKNNNSKKEDIVYTNNTQCHESKDNNHNINQCKRESDASGNGNTINVINTNMNSSYKNEEWVDDRVTLSHKRMDQNTNSQETHYTSHHTLLSQTQKPLRLEEVELSSPPLQLPEHEEESLLCSSVHGSRDVMFDVSRSNFTSIWDAVHSNSSSSSLSSSLLTQRTLPKSMIIRSFNNNNYHSNPRGVLQFSSDEQYRSYLNDANYQNRHDLFHVTSHSTNLYHDAPTVLFHNTHNFNSAEDDNVVLESS